MLIHRAVTTVLEYAGSSSRRACRGMDWMGYSWLKHTAQWKWCCFKEVTQVGGQIVWPQPWQKYNTISHQESLTYLEICFCIQRPNQNTVPISKTKFTPPSWYQQPEIILLQISSKKIIYYAQRSRLKYLWSKNLKIA